MSPESTKPNVPPILSASSPIHPPAYLRQIFTPATTTTTSDAPTPHVLSNSSYTTSDLIHEIYGELSSAQRRWNEEGAQTQAKNNHNSKDTDSITTQELEQSIFDAFAVSPLSAYDYGYYSGDEDPGFSQEGSDVPPTPTYYRLTGVTTALESYLGAYNQEMQARCCEGDDGKTPVPSRDGPLLPLLPVLARRSARVRRLTWKVVEMKQQAFENEERRRLRKEKEATRVVAIRGGKEKMKLGGEEEAVRRLWPIKLGEPL